jgi:hypothetical protein
LNPSVLPHDEQRDAPAPRRHRESQLIAKLLEELAGVSAASLQLEVVSTVETRFVDHQAT